MTKLMKVLTGPEFRKLQTALVGVILAACAANLLPQEFAMWTSIIVQALTVAGVGVVPNVPASEPRHLADKNAPQPEFIETPAMG